MYQPYTIQFLGGLNEDENPAVIQPNQLRVASNTARLGALTGTRPGLVRDSQYDADISGDPIIHGLHEYRSGRDANRQLVAIADGVVHTSDTVTVTQAGGVTITAPASAASDYRWSMATYQDLLWGVGGASGDSIWSWDGSGDITARLSTLGIRPRYAFAKFNTLLFGGFYTGTDAWNNPLVARYCDYAADATDALSWPNSNSIPGLLLGENSGVASYGQEYNTGFGSFTDNRGDFLFFLTNKRIISFRENPNVSSNANRFVQTDAISNGCVSQSAYVDLGFDQGDAIYVSSQGIHSVALSQQFGNRESVFLSWPIRKTFETINRSRLETIQAAYWPDEGMVVIGIPTGSNTYLDTLLCCDIKGAKQISPDTVRWYKWTLSGVNASVITVARDPSTDTPRIYVGGQAGEVAAFNRGTYSDLGSAYGTLFRTKDEDYGAPTVEKAIGDTNVMARGTGNYSPSMAYLVDDSRKTISSEPIDLTLDGFVLDNTAGNLSGASTMDNAEGTLVGAGILGSDSNVIRERIVGCGTGYTVALQFSHSAANEPFFIGQVTQEIAGSGRADETAAA